MFYVADATGVVFACGASCYRTDKLRRCCLAHPLPPLILGADVLRYTLVRWRDASVPRADVPSLQWLAPTSGDRNNSSARLERASYYDGFWQFSSPHWASIHLQKEANARCHNDIPRLEAFARARPDHPWQRSPVRTAFGLERGNFSCQHMKK
jgi:hypothetical protein